MTQGIEILVLDDEHEAADLLATLIRLSFDDALVHVVYTGEDAVSAGAARRIDAAVLDLEMPGMGGEAAAVALRAQRTDGRALLIALSGNVLRLAELRTSGPFDVLMSKPVDIRALTDALKARFPDLGSP